MLQGSGISMPPNGPVWQEYRVMGLPDLKGVCMGFNVLLKVSNLYSKNSMGHFCIKIMFLANVGLRPHSKARSCRGDKGCGFLLKDSVHEQPVTQGIK